MTHWIQQIPHTHSSTYLWMQVSSVFYPRWCRQLNHKMKKNFETKWLDGCLENESTNRQPTVAFLVPCLISFNWVKTASLSLRTRTKSKLSIFEQLESGSKSTRSQVRVKSSQLNCKMLSKVVELSSSCVDALDQWPKNEGRYCGQKKLLWYCQVSSDSIKIINAKKYFVI